MASCMAVPRSESCIDSGILSKASSSRSCRS
nr:MAG TPA: hypothetical protein [Caudoviricetes sp.]